jgi:hypothetical protein
MTSPDGKQGEMATYTDIIDDNHNNLITISGDNPDDDIKCQSPEMTAPDNNLYDYSSR